MADDVARSAYVRARTVVDLGTVRRVGRYFHLTRTHARAPSGLFQLDSIFEINKGVRTVRGTVRRIYCKIF